MSTPPIGHEHRSGHRAIEDPFQLIEACLNRRRGREEDYQQAIEHLLGLMEELKSGGEISVVTLYTYLFQLIPHFEEEKLTRFCGSHMSSLLRHSPDMHEEHRKLALALGNWKLAHPRGQTLGAALQACRDAMDYYVEAIAIAEEHGIEVDETHRQASASFAQILKYTLLQALPIKQRILDATRAWQTDPDQFFRCYDALTHHIERLKLFRCDVEGEEVIKGVYEQIREALNLSSDEFKQQPRFQAGNYFANLRVKLAEPIPQPEKWPTQRYREGLREFRAHFEALSLDDVRAFQAENTQRFLSFFRNSFFTDIEAFFLGFFPCPYDLRAMGSIGRMELSRRFDLEYLILIGDETKREFFKQVAELVGIQMLSLGESPLAASSSHTLRESLPLRFNKGFHVDSGGNPAQQSETLIRTPEKMAELQHAATEGPQSLENTARQTISLVNSEGAGDDSSLHLRYQRCLAQIFGPECGASLRVNKGTIYMIRRWMAYREMPPPFGGPNGEIDLKTEFMEPLFHLLSDMAFYSGLPGNNTLDLIEGLANIGLFSARSKELLIKAVSYICAARIAVSSVSEHQKELEQIYWLVSRPLYTALGTCFEVVPNPSDKNARAELEARPDITILRPTEREVRPTYVRVLQPFENGFRNLDLVSMGFEEVVISRKKNPTFFKPYIEQLVPFLIAQQVSEDEFLRYFQSLTEREELEPLGKAFLDKRVKVLVALHKEGEAVEALAQVLAVEPNNVSALMQRGKLLAQQGRHREALPDFHRVVCLDPNDEQALKMRATMHQSLGHPDLALADVARASKIHKEDVELYLVAAAAYRDKAEHELALERLDRLSDLDAEHRGAAELRQQVILMIAAKHRDEGKYDSALEHLDRLLRFDPENRAATEMRRRVMGFIREDKLNWKDTSKADLPEAVKGDEDNLPFLLSRATLLISSAKEHTSISVHRIFEYLLRAVGLAMPNFASLMMTRRIIPPLNQEIPRWKRVDEELKKKIEDKKTSQSSQSDLHLLRMMLELIEGRFDSALKSLAKAISLHPKNGASLRAIRARIYLAQGNYSLALQDILIGCHPWIGRFDSRDDEVVSGHLANWLDDDVRLKEVIYQGLQSNPDDIALLKLRALLNLINDDPPNRALVDLTQILAHSPDDFFALATRAYVYRVTGFWAAAVRDLQKAMLLEPKDVIVLTLRHSNLTLLGQYPVELALGDLEEILKNSPDNELALKVHADITARLAASREELACLERRAPLDADDLINRANIYTGCGHLEKAIADLTLALQKCPNHQGALNERWKLYYRLQNHDAALGDLNRLEELHDAHLLARGTIHWLKKNYVLAAQDWTPIIISDESSLNSLIGPRVIPEYEDALRHLREAAGGECLDDINVLALRGELFRRTGEPDRAIEDFCEVLRREPSNSFALGRRGYLYCESRTYVKALADLRLALKSDPKNSFASRCIGLTEWPEGFIQEWWDASIGDPPSTYGYWEQ